MLTLLRLSMRGGVCRGFKLYAVVPVKICFQAPPVQRPLLYSRLCFHAALSSEPSEVETVRKLSDFPKRKSARGTPTMTQYALNRIPGQAPLADPLEGIVAWEGTTVEANPEPEVPLEVLDPADNPPRPAVPEPSRSLNAEELARYSLSQARWVSQQPSCPSCPN
eukprot:7935543-Pyramimonas_sp.AAC.1